MKKMGIITDCVFNVGGFAALSPQPFSRLNAFLKREVNV